MQRTYLLQEQLKIIKRELGLEVLLVIIKVGVSTAPFFSSGQPRHMTSLLLSLSSHVTM